MNTHAINFSINRQFDRIDYIFIKLIERYFTTISFYGIFNVIIDILVRNKNQDYICDTSVHSFMERY